MSSRASHKKVEKLGFGNRPAADSLYKRDSLKDGLGAQWKFWKRKRYVIVLLVFFGLMNVGTVRLTVSFALTAMVKYHGKKQGEFDWTRAEESYVTSSFFWGHICTVLFSGWLASKVGGARLFGISIGIPAFLLILTPAAARIHVAVVICLRILEGMLQAFSLTSVQDLWNHWLPPLERDRMMAMAHVGGFLGNVITIMGSAALIFHVDWQFIFHFFGAVGCLWYGLWLTFVYRSPEEDMQISDRELIFLRYHVETHIRDIKHPWKRILTSFPIYALMCVCFSINWGHIIIFTQLPAYMQDILNFNVKETGFYTALPFMVFFVVMQITGNVVQYILIKDIMSTTKVRKIFICCGFCIQGGFMFAVGMAANRATIIAFLVLGATAGSLVVPNYLVNHMDVAAMHAPVTFGMAETVGTIPGILLPLLRGAIVQKSLASEWRTVFMISGGVFWMGCIVYLIFGTADLQEWAVQKKEISESSLSESES